MMVSAEVLKPSVAVLAETLIWMGAGLPVVNLEGGP
jgi:hypothetical protein